LALSHALDCTVEELFDPTTERKSNAEWAFPPKSSGRRYWKARVGSRVWVYPIEDESPQLSWHDGVYRRDVVPDASGAEVERTLVVACCDPSAALLAAEYARQFQFRMIVLQRGSRAALGLLADGKVHVAGIHLGHGSRGSDNAQAARAAVGDNFRLIRVARWEEGIAIAPHLKTKRVTDLLQSGARWVGREEGSGARQCQDQVLGERPAPRRTALDHRSVTAAVRCGWADVGPSVRVASEEAGLRFIKVQEKDYDLCFSVAHESDPRLIALLATIRSRRYRALLSELPGYSTRQTGEMD